MYKTWILKIYELYIYLFFVLFVLFVVFVVFCCCCLFLLGFLGGFLCFCLCYLVVYFSIRVHINIYHNLLSFTTESSAALCLYHVTVGSGIPVTLHTKDTVSPSTAVRSRDDS